MYVNGYSESLKGRDHLEYLDISRKTILKGIVGK
jgi:hypothetical protein